jgi:hypothetical protein
MTYTCCSYTRTCSTTCRRMRFGATLLCGTISVHVTLVVLFVFTYVNVHRCQEDDGRVQVLMVERPSSLKLRNKQRIHRNGSDQNILKIITRCVTL